MSTSYLECHVSVVRNLAKNAVAHIESQRAVYLEKELAPLLKPRRKWFFGKIYTITREQAIQELNSSGGICDFMDRESIWYGWKTLDRCKAILKSIEFMPNESTITLSVEDSKMLNEWGR